MNGLTGGKPFTMLEINFLRLFETIFLFIWLEMLKYKKEAFVRGNSLRRK